MYETFLHILQTLCSFFLSILTILIIVVFSQENFKQKARTKLKKGGTKNADASKKLVIRHAGVLGLCSFINAHPYDVPEYLPSVFAALGPHLSDPQPVPVS